MIDAQICRVKLGTDLCIITVGLLISSSSQSTCTKENMRAILLIDYHRVSAKKGILPMEINKAVKYTNVV